MVLLSNLYEPTFLETIGMTQIALFPIPNLVAFPKTVVPLHVFEPRYRQMIKECVASQKLIGVCHTQGVLSQPKKKQTPQEALQNNQSTFVPQNIFSAGFCTIREITPDGRLYCDIEMQDRYKIVSEVQTLPYKIVEAELYQDQPGNNEKEAELYKKSILDFLIQVFQNQEPSLYELLKSSNWQSMSADDFSFKVFNFLKLEADSMQEILELQTSNDRLKVIAQALKTKPSYH